MCKIVLNKLNNKTGKKYYEGAGPVRSVTYAVSQPEEQRPALLPHNLPYIRPSRSRFKHPRAFFGCYLSMLMLLMSALLNDLDLI